MANNRHMKTNKYIAPQVEVITVGSDVMKITSASDGQNQNFGGPAPQRRVTDVF